MKTIPPILALALLLVLAPLAMLGCDGDGLW